MHGRPSDDRAPLAPGWTGGPHASDRVRTRSACDRSGAALRSVALLTLTLAACAQEAPSADVGGDSPRDSDAVLPGLEVLLADSVHLVAGRRVGFITNHTSVDRAGRSGIDVLHQDPRTELVALFGPEHGLRGAAEAGERVADGVDASTGLPAYSLYSSTRSPPPEALEGVDVLLFDIQDVGARYYTYVSTMALAMEAAGSAGIPFVVLDRPNPIGGALVQGNTLDPEFSSFVGMYPVPMRHGMTPGELARLYVGEFGLEVELHVVPAEGWRREVGYEGTGLPWIAPSPNMPTVESALHYPGTCLFEGTNLSVGRGTERPFQWIGAPWIDGASLAERLNGYGLAGVRFEPVTFTPENPGDGKFAGETVHGVRFVATDPSAYDPTKAAVAALIEARDGARDRWGWASSHFDRLAGTDRLRAAIDRGDPLEAVVAGWSEANARFERLRRPYLIYP